MCGSSLRLPITSPPGGGTTARPCRARSGPASRNDARIWLASASSTSCPMSRAWTRTSFAPIQSASAPDRAEQAEHRLDVADPRDVRERHLLVGEQASRENRQRAVLVAGSTHTAGERVAAFDHERFRHGSDDGRGHLANYARWTMSVTREQAWTTLTQLHEERSAAPARTCRRGLDRLLCGPLRRGRGAVAGHSAAPRLRLRDPSDARQASAGRGADPP